MVFFLFLFNSNVAFPENPLFKELQGPKVNIQKMIGNYLKIHRKFSRQTCPSGTEETFWKKTRFYHNNNLFIPLLKDHKLDKLSLRQMIPQIEKKIVWIEQKMSQVKKIKSFKKDNANIKKLGQMLKKLLTYKEKYYDYKGKDLKIKNKIRKESRHLMGKFKNRMFALFEKISFLRSYGYPVNHLELRGNYDRLKRRKDLQSRQRANEVYFYRRIVQDGARDSKTGKRDMLLRTNLDTIQYGLAEELDFISEDLRFDIFQAFEKIRKILARGPKRQVANLKNWKRRTQESLQFYKLLDQDDGINRSLGSVVKDQQWVSSKLEATQDLKHFNFQKQKQVYKFWKEYSDLWQAVFVIETILFNEVGTLDQKSGLEKRDIAQVAINRHNHPQYNMIPPSDGLFSYLYPDVVQKDASGVVRENPWPNVLFKKGEFSFTYFFLRGSVRIYCPDMTGVGKKLRRKNVRLALEMLQNPNHTFQGVRYFSRVSMLGGIDMGRLWKNFVAIPERPGIPLASWKGVKKQYLKGKYNYHYHFLDDAKGLYKVVGIGGKDYVLNCATMDFFEHRNPHYFRYFSPK